MPDLRSVDRIKSNGLDAATGRKGRRTTAKLCRLAGRLRTLATEILRDIPEHPDRPVDEGERKLRSDRDSSPRKGYQWPASALTHEDMRMLDELRRDSRTPIAALVHQAIAALYAIPRADIARLEQLREMTGRSIRDLVTEAVATVWERHAGAAESRELGRSEGDNDSEDPLANCSSSKPAQDRQANA